MFQINSASKKRNEYIFEESFKSSKELGNRVFLSGEFKGVKYCDHYLKNKNGTHIAATAILEKQDSTNIDQQLFYVYLIRLMMENEPIAFLKGMAQKNDYMLKDKASHTKDDLCLCVFTKGKYTSLFFKDVAFAHPEYVATIKKMIESDIGLFKETEFYLFYIYTHLP